MQRYASLARATGALFSMLGLAACVDSPVGQGSSAGFASPATGYSSDSSLSLAAPALQFSAASSPALSVQSATAEPLALSADLTRLANAEPASPLLAHRANVPLPPSRPLEASLGRTLNLTTVARAAQAVATAPALTGALATVEAAPRVQLAALFVEGARILLPAQRALERDGLIERQTTDVSISCFPDSLKAVLADISQHFGNKPVVVTSGFRSEAHNRHAGGAGHSYHTQCLAADIQIDGVAPAAIAHYARTLDAVGGVGRYGHTKSVHVDVGERKFSWFGLHRRHRRSA